MSETGENEFKLSSEIIAIVKKCDPNVDLTNLNFKSLKDIWQYLKTEEQKVDDELKMCESKDVDLKNHMEQLHHYNDIKDVTQEVLGRLADLCGISVVDAHKKFDLDGNL